MAPGNNSKPPSVARAYFLTCGCYGAWFHGDEAGSVDKKHNLFGTPVVEPNRARELIENHHMTDAAYFLDTRRRNVVLEAIKEVCNHRKWWLFALHVRSTHVHVVVQSGYSPEKVTNDFKSYSSRSLSRTGWDQPDSKRWARHGSTRYLWKEEDLVSAIDYVLHRQGEPMQVYFAPANPPSTV